MTNGGINMGASSFNELLPTILVNSLSIKEAYTPDFLVKANFTVSTFMPSIYLDFGKFGLMIFTFIII